MASILDKTADQRPPDTRQDVSTEPLVENRSQVGLYVRAFRLMVQGLFRLFFRVRVLGLSNLPRTPIIICPNHLGWADPFLILCFLPVRPRIYALGYSLEYVADEGARAFRSRVVNSLQVMIQLKVDRPIEAVRVMRETLRGGGSLLIFPEGTYMGANEGRIQPFQEGAAHLSILTGTPIVPVGITGSKELWLRRTIVLRIGKPILPERFEGSTHERMYAMTSQLEVEVQGLLPGDHTNARVKLLRNWLSGLFRGEEHFQHGTHHSRMQAANRSNLDPEAGAREELN